MSSNLCVVCKKKAPKCQNPAGCENHICPKDALCLVPEEETKIEKLVELCEPCFRSMNALDFDTNYDVAGEEGKPVIICLHGALTCRRMWAPYLRKLSDRFRLIALDLPEHGSRMGEALTVESAMAAINEAADRYSPNQPFIIWGLSLGGYLSYHYIDQFPDRVRAAVICDSSQTTGPGAGILAKIGLFAMGFAGGMASKKIMNFMVKQGKDVEPEVMREMVFRCGWFNRATPHCIEILKHVNPDVILPKFKKPVMLAYGTKDHHDGQKRWMKLLENGSELSYPSDHFFTHHKVYMNQFIEDVAAWIGKVLEEQEVKTEEKQEEKQETVEKKASSSSSSSEKKVTEEKQKSSSSSSPKKPTATEEKKKSSSSSSSPKKTTAEKKSSSSSSTHSVDEKEPIVLAPRTEQEEVKKSSSSSSSTEKE